MRIGINALFYIPGKVGGTESYLRGLIYGLQKVDKENSYIIFTNKENQQSFRGSFESYLCNFSAKFKLQRIFSEQIFLPQLVRKFNLDVLHSPGYIAPFRINCANVVTIHDMQHIFYFKNYKNSKFKPQFIYWNLMIPSSARFSNIIFTVSNFSKNEIASYLDIPLEKIIVTYEASKLLLNEKFGEVDLSKKYGIEKKFILSIAQALPHKNIEGLINAFALLLNKIDHQLILVGLKGEALKSIFRLVERNKISKDRIAWLGYVPDSDLAALYKNASLFVMPSFFEGFGIPLVEAMSLGCPVVASNRTSIPEITGDSALLFDPENVQEIADTIYFVLSNGNLKSDLIKKGYKRAENFSWEKMAQQTMNGYKLAYGKFVS